MNKAIIYIHGKDGKAEEAKHYAPLFPQYQMIGFDYLSQTPWEAKDEFRRYFSEIRKNYDIAGVIANSIGAYFLMNTPEAVQMQEAWFISPIVDMEALIAKMMLWSDVTEDDLRREQIIPTSFGETLSWEYLSYVHNHPLHWTLPTNLHILYGEKDNLTDYAIISSFAERADATLDVMPGGEHWFHTDEQMAFLDSWISQSKSPACREELKEKLF